MGKKPFFICFTGAIFIGSFSLFLTSTPDELGNIGTLACSLLAFVLITFLFFCTLKLKMNSRANHSVHDANHVAYKNKR